MSCPACGRPVPESDSMVLAGPPFPCGGCGRKLQMSITGDVELLPIPIEVPELPSAATAALSSPSLELDLDPDIASARAALAAKKAQKKPATSPALQPAQPSMASDKTSMLDEAKLDFNNFQLGTAPPLSAPTSPAPRGSSNSGSIERPQALSEKPGEDTLTKGKTRPTPTFPAVPWAIFKKELLTWLPRAPLGVKLGLAAAALVPIVVVVGLVVWLSKPSISAAYVTEAAQVYLAPDPEAQVLFSLQRGNRVEACCAVAGMSWVRDSLGRAGWVGSPALADKAPLTAPEAFVDCARASFELSAEPCFGRAEAQRMSCLDFCDESANIERCLGDCQNSFVNCQNHCAAEPEHQKLEGPPQAAAAAPPPPEAQPEAAEPDKPVAAEKPVAKKKVKKRRGR